MEHPFEKKLREAGLIPPLPAPLPASGVVGQLPQIDHPLVSAALDARIRELAVMPPRSGRNDALNKAAAYLGRFPIPRQQLRDLLMSACQANGLVAEDGEKACDATIRSGFNKADRDGPRTIENRTNGAVHEVNVVDITSKLSTKSNLLSSIFDVENGFWDARESLKHIYSAALIRMCSPWAVLAFCAARALTLVRPNVTLPPLIGGPGSLNWFAAIAAPSGGGKGSASAVARELVSEYVREKNLGSGEGIIGAYYKPGGKDKLPEINEANMFSADEIDTIAALGSRSGSTTMSVLRSAFSGETLGFSYIARGRDIHLDAHSYRMTMVISVQPARAGALLGDHRGGTPQRFMWFPGIDHRIDAPTSPDVWMPGPVRLPRLDNYPKQLTVPPEARDFIIEQRVKAARGENAAIDGHAVFCREKFAYALALLDGRTDMSSEDWRLSGIASEISARTREWVAEQQALADEIEAQEKGRLLGVSATASDEEKAYRVDQRGQRIARWVISKLEGGPMTNRELSRTITSRDRVWLKGALDGLMNAGLIGQDDQNRWVKL